MTAKSREEALGCSVNHELEEPGRRTRMGPRTSLEIAQKDVFTETEYIELLGLAAAKYQFVDVATNIAIDGPAVVWRHDVDHSIHRALALAEIEHARGARASYHLMTASRYYNLLEPEVIRIVRRIAGLGHHLGLHLDLDVFGEEATVDHAAMEARVLFERGVIETVAGASLTSMSFHNHLLNTARITDAIRIGGLVNASAPEFFDSVRYVSDSNGLWRRDRLRDVLAGPTVARLMVLTHPEWWTPEGLTPFERMRRCVSGRAEANLELYVYQLARDGRLSPIAECSGLPENLIARVLAKAGLGGGA